MKILLIHYRFFITGGPERYLFNLKSSLEKRGHTVIPFSVKTSKNIISEYENFFAENIGKCDEVYVEKYPKKIRTYCDLISREFYSYHVRKRLLKLIKKEQPDICYLLVYKRALSPSVIDACYKMNIPIINRLSDYNAICASAHLYRNGKACEKCVGTSKIYCLKFRCLKGSFIFSLMRFLSIYLHKTLRIENKISKFICTNEFMMKQMIKDGYDKNKLELLPTFFHETAATIRQRKPNIISDKILFLFIGTMDEKKGIYDLLQALSLLKNTNDNFILDIIGGVNNDENEKVLKLVADFGLKEYIHFKPFQTDGNVFDYYLNANVTIIPCRWYENLPNTLIESIYFQRPVVVPDFASFKYSVDHSVSFKYKALNVESLYNILNKILSSPELIIEKSNNCKSFYEKNFSENEHLDKLTDLFESTIKDIK